MTDPVLARKWRPKDFASLVGQEHVVKALKYALEQQRLHHAYLFSGTRGVGKTTLSRILTKALNCETGITATPCGQCKTCIEIDAARSVDYIEMDAASNRSVDEMSALLERAIYAPVAARFKIYMIDEAHMLTHHAFNAMLKTLEEPPPHVKFILATTDPKKIPVTVLSRCLQFNLKQMPAAQIAAALEKILFAENVRFELEAVHLLAHAADGSMRDALSLTDQAIAYAARNLSAGAIQDMLGIAEQRYLIQLLDALVERNGAAVLDLAGEMAARSVSFSQVLQDLASLLHQIAWSQYAPASVLDTGLNAEDIRRFAGLLSPEDVQLYYQIATVGRSELGLAPDEYAGFTMTLLRMLAFRSIDINKHSASEKTDDCLEHFSASLQLARARRQDGDRYGRSRAAEGGAGSIALRAMDVTLESAPSSLLEKLGRTAGDLAAIPNTESGEVTQCKPLRNALASPARAALDTLNGARSAHDPAIAQRQQEAERALKQDAFVKALMRDFGATLIPGSFCQNSSTFKESQS